MKNHTTRYLPTLAAAPLLFTIAHGAPIAPDWSASSAAVTLSSPAGTGVSATGTNMNSGYRASLTPSGSAYAPTSTGDVLKLSGTITPGGTLASATDHPGSIRLGLFDDTGSADTKGWSGYFALWDTAGSGGTSGGLYERNGSAQDYWSGTGATRLTTYAGAEPSFTSGAAYAFTFTLTKTISGMRIEARAYDTATPTKRFLDSSYEDTGAALTSFSRAGFYTATGLGADAFTISDLDVSLVAVPEPGAWASLIAAGGATAMVVRRRKTRKA